jgi:prefoldin alpha subunit
MSGGDRQTQAINQQLQELEQVKEAIDEEISALRTRKTDIDSAIDAVERLESGSEVRVPLGGGAYVTAEIQDVDEILVEMGADFAVERTGENAVEALERKKGRLDDQIDDLQAERSEVDSESEALTQQAQQHLQQQMSQQMGQQDRDE